MDLGKRVDMGMGKGSIWPAEWKTYRDRLTGVLVTQLTSYKTHNYHLYFTENGWYDDDRKLLFKSDRGNSANLYSLDLRQGEITQLTDYRDNDRLGVCLHPSGQMAFLNVAGEVRSLSLTTLREEPMYAVPQGFNIGNLSCTADGRYVVTCIQEDFSDRLDLDLGHGYIGHRELMEAAPTSKIIMIDVETNETKIVYEARRFITHINASPTESWLITFCHEGPWHLVDHRIWGLDLRNGKAWKIRERLEPREKVGHEFFFPDGQTIGYHGFRENGMNFFGQIRYDNTGMKETDFPFDTWHSHADGGSQTVVDGKGDVQTLCLWRKIDGKVYGPRVLCELRCSFHSQQVHAHPRFSADGKRILFTSDKNGYAQLYLVDIPDDFASLPELSLT